MTSKEKAEEWAKMGLESESTVNLLNKDFMDFATYGSIYYKNGKRVHISEIDFENSNIKTHRLTSEEILDKYNVDEQKKKP